MKILGVSALAMTLMSFIFWFIQWVLLTFFSNSYTTGSPLRYVGQTSSVLSLLSEYIALGLLSIGLILVAGRLTKDAPRTEETGT